MSSSDVQRIFTFLSDFKGDWKTAVDDLGNGDGYIVKSEFSYFIEKKMDWAKYFAGYGSGNQISDSTKKSIINEFWDSIDTNKTIKHIGNSRLYNQNALDEVEMNKIDERLKNIDFIKEAVDTIMTEIRKEYDSKLTDLDVTHKDQWNQSIRASLMEAADKWTAGHSKNTVDLENYLRTNIKAGAISKTTANVYSQYYINNERRNLLSGLDYNVLADETLQRMVDKFVTRNGKNGFDEIKIAAKSLVNAYLSTTFPNKTSSKGDVLYYNQNSLNTLSDNGYTPTYYPNSELINPLQQANVKYILEKDFKSATSALKDEDKTFYNKYKADFNNEISNFISNTVSAMLYKDYASFLEDHSAVITAGMAYAKEQVENANGIASTPVTTTTTTTTTETVTVTTTEPVVETNEPEYINVPDYTSSVVSQVMGLSTTVLGKKYSTPETFLPLYYVSYNTSGTADKGQIQFVYRKNNGGSNEINFDQTDENGVFNNEKNDVLNTLFNSTLKGFLESKYSDTLNKVGWSISYVQERKNLFNSAMFATLSEYKTQYIYIDTEEFMTKVATKYHDMLFDVINGDKTLKAFVSNYNKNSLLAGRSLGTTNVTASNRDKTNSDVNWGMNGDTTAESNLSSRWNYIGYYYRDDSTQGRDDVAAIKTNIVNSNEVKEYGLYDYSNKNMQLYWNKFFASDSDSHVKMTSDKIYNLYFVYTDDWADNVCLNYAINKLCKDYITKYVNNSKILDQSTVIEYFRQAELEAFNVLDSVTTNKTAYQEHSTQLYGFTDQQGANNNMASRNGNGEYWNVGAVVLQIMYEMETLIASKIM